MIIFRYLAKEVTAALSAITGILLVIFLSNQLVRYLGRAASGKIPGGIIFKLMMIQIPHLLGLLLPLGLFLGILLSYGRLYAESEMTVMRATGMSARALLSMTMVVAIVVMSLVALSTFYLDPIILAHKNDLIEQEGAATELSMIFPGRFQQSEDGKRIFYVEKMSRDREKLQNVFVAEKVSNKNNNEWYVLTADSAKQWTDPKTEHQFLVFKNGYRYQGNAGEKKLSTVKFGKYGIRIDQPAEQAKQDQETMSTHELWQKRDDVSNAAELQWRAAMPLSGLILAFMAVPLSRVRPRQGKYAKILPAILVYLVYANLILVSHNWLDDGDVPVWLGMWWVHLSAFIFAFLLFALQAGWRNFFAILGLRKS